MATRNTSPTPKYGDARQSWFPEFHDLGLSYFRPDDAEVRTTQTARLRLK